MRYRAFISYSHADEAWARWLFKRLETYRVPPRLVGRQTAYGIISSRLGKFFRDRDELTASNDLSATIQSVLAESEALIVVCSPIAATSRWVNAEVESFRASGREDRIFAFVVAGDPGIGADAGGCFPDALLAAGEDGQSVEPLAADARPEADGRKRAFLKLVAGLLGVGFDELAQREAQRKQGRLVQVAMASLAAMTIAIGLAVTAYVARNDAQRRQAQAEDIVGFMLGDLREKLTKVGRLDLMRVVDDKATTYFATLDPRDLSDRALEEQARSLTGIGQVRLDEGNHPEARSAFNEAHARSTALHARQPENGERLFDLAQAEYWIGYVAWQQGRFDDTAIWFRQYRDSAIKLAAMDPGNFDWQREVAYGHHNLGVLDEKLGRYTEAERVMREELTLYRTWTRQYPEDTSVRYEAANVASWLGSLMLRQGRLAEAEAFFAEQLDGYDRNARAEPDNATWKDRRVASLILLTDAQVAQGNIPPAKANIDTACTLGAALLEQDASNNAWRTALGTCRWWQAQVERARQSSLSATRAADATTLLTVAHDTEPRNERILRWLARARQLEASLLLERRDFSGADRHLVLASSLLEPAWQAEQNEDLRLWLAWNRLLEGDVDHARGDAASAKRSWSAAQVLLRGGGDGEVLPFARLDPLLRTLTALGLADETAPVRQRLQAAGYVPIQAFAPETPVAAR